MPRFAYLLLSLLVLSPSLYAEQRWIQGIGYVEPTSEIRRLAFKHPGILGEYKVLLDQQVKTGSILAVQHNTEEQSAVAVAESQLSAAKADLEKVLAGINPYEIEAKKNAQRVSALDAEYARRKLERINQLRNHKFASEDERDLAETNAKLKQADNRRLTAETHFLSNYVRDVDKQLALAQVSVAEAQLQAARQRLAETYLIAPIDGTVLERILRVGESTFSVGSPEPAILLGDMSKLRVRAEIDENYALMLQQGQKAVIFGRGLGEKEIPAHVTLVKKIMGKKTVFAKTATERKDIDVIQVFVEPDTNLQTPVGLEVNVKIAIN
ncbi:MAG: efflux RND transporter periplasmic adaptor subunit [Methylomonas sp.]|jgi:HlyD family secretion protein|uniref:HlyD family secretion protein n=1 Tax=Methylomonas sp. TaxID=418 RepID=UPI0025EF9530|nr:efflux RND transporter periplasmic adaptor subunit [Methylomonas sp.]MCK9606020.1 efflux RND transporter periplasmic adaptor subunit [Methylomonas sp.]